MKQTASDEITVRRYLLGDADARVSDKLEERMLADDDFATTVELIEDEIIEDYLDGTLDPLDRERVEKHFLCPPERRQKLHLARQLNEQPKAGRLIASEPESTTLTAVPVPYWRSHLRTWAELAAGLVITIGAALYIVPMRQGFQSEIGKANRELERERQHSAELTQELKATSGFQPSTTVLLTLLQSDNFRSGEELPSLQLGPSTQQIHIEITLSDGPGPYDVRLERANNGGAANNVIWSKPQVQPFRSFDTSILMIDVPATGIAPGKYELFLRLPGGSEIPFSFEVKRSQ